MERLLSRAEVMELLGRISASTLWRLENSGRLRCVRIGRRVLFPERELQRFVESARRARRTA